MRTPRPRVVSFVLNNFTNDNRVYKTARSLAQAGYDVTVMALKRGDVVASEDMDGFKVRRIELRADALPEGKHFTAVRLAELITKTVWLSRDFDIIHCNDFNPMLVAAALKKLNPRLKVVYDTHEYAREKNGVVGMHREFVKRMEPVVIRSADEVITVSEGIAREYERIFSLDKVHVIYNAPHRQEPEGGDLLREELGILSDRIIFLYQGGLVRGRGVELLLEAFELLEDTRAALVFMGHGEHKTTVQEAMRVRPNVFFRPSVPYDRIVDYTSSADWGLLSVENVCLSYFYCMPNKMFEYIQSQIPIITTNLNDCRKMIEDEGLGIVIPEFTARSVAETIRRALEADPSVFEEGLQRAREKYHWEAEERKLLEIYAGLFR